LEYARGQIDAYCYMVQRGKPAACLPLQERYIDAAQSLIEEKGLKVFIQPLSSGWITLWIYRYQHISHIIKQLPQVPKTVYDHWMLGKVFGYDEQSISDYLKDKII
jgi:hypothetical protein